MVTFNFKKWNTILGWFTFAIALITYSLTVEPSLSFWDCGEYIATSAKLEVGHPPGAPLFQMMGAFFAMFASGPEKVALMVNMMSVFSSAFTILFMFWSMTLILKKVVSSYTEFNKNNAIVVLGSALVGSLAFTFTDSFWFSATEAEVYAMASLFIAVLFWLALRWEEDMHSPRGNKWLLLISLMIGLSFGVHFMALLTIPSIGLLYYFKNYKTVTVKNFIIANIVIVVILFFVFKFLLPYTLAFFGKMEIFMVNSLGLPFNSGTIFAALLIVLFFYFGLRYTKKKEKPLYNTLLLCILFVLIGFSTWLMLPIRANANVVINENRPSDAAEVLAYYNREQYGEQKTFYGPLFTEGYVGLDEENPYQDEKPNYERDYKTGTYKIVNNYVNARQNTSDDQKAFLPRMWSTDNAVNYMTFTRPVKFTINPEYSHEDELVQIVSEFRNAYGSGKLGIEEYDKFLKAYGEYLIIEKPSFIDNMQFMFEYQFGYMYWRYLMWNFTGRQNDIQGKYDTQNGNWISGIKFIDSIRLGSQDNLPSDVLNNKARNTYYFLPFILGIIGMVFHARKDLKSFYVLLVLFLFTSLALKVFLNERPFEPRERDYALVGSFYIFAMWLGFGVYAIYDGIKNYLQPKIAGPVVIAACLLAAPVLMAKENWDDHDRSHRYTAVAMAKAYLDSCEPNAILFTIGDNDTFPLWYAQEIEGYRTDVRIVNTQLFTQDWYIDQMKSKAYNSDPLPISFTHDQYVKGKRDYMFFQELTKDRIDIKQFIDFIKSDDERTLFTIPRSGQKIHFYPTNKIRIPVDKATVIKNKVVNPALNDSIVPAIDFEIKGSALYINRLMMLDLVYNNNWKRPIYFTGGSFGDDDYIWMKDYLQLDGMVYKLVPVKTPIPKDGSPLDMGNIDTEKMYKIVMSWDWGNSGDPRIYHDPETRKNSISYRTNLARLTEKLIAEGKKDKAKNVIDLAMQKMPIDEFGFYTFVEPFASGYYEVGETTKARDILNKLSKKYQENLTYYKGLKAVEQNDMYVDIVTDIERYRALLDIMKRYDKDFFNANRTKFNSYNKLFERFGRDME
ncbi:DUF2723 domain-containing protein [Flavobacterium supellecticarium]|uniref:DUF2723 domain-containing protein n=1 Tax=Flavobacterium supellecticarium TaxID=2565924 RepID=A0A4V3W7V8_9FLAO|nr:DUF2723 domain-containing protein [Flavobacterium supellecticarium]THF48835.1 DUF2723 domain-containing protein [Flavobacterium supellecticarium]